MGADRGPLVLTAQLCFLGLFAADGARYRHTVGVVGQARAVARTVDQADVDLLLAAAWLHDIGHAPQLRDSGFHALDAARYLDRAGWLRRLCGLVAFHSGSYFVAVEIGLGAELREFRDEQGPVADALTYADQTTGPYGEHLSVEHRMDEMLRRHGPDSPHARAHAQRAPYLRAAASRVQQRLSSSRV